MTGFYNRDSVYCAVRTGNLYITQVNLCLAAAMRQVFLRALPLPPVNITIPPTLNTQHHLQHLAGQMGEAWEP
jgi:hypothetical protein